MRPKAIILGLICLAGCGNPPAPIPAAPTGFDLYAFQDQTGKIFVVPIPKDLEQVASRTHDEYFFNGKHGETLSIAPVSNLSSNELETAQAFIKSMGEKDAIRTTDGSTAVADFRVVKSSTGMVQKGVGMWLRDSSSVAIDYRTLTNKTDVESAIKSMVKGIYYDDHAQSIEKLKELAKSDVKVATKR